MSKVNEQLVRDMFRSIDAGDWDSLGAYFAPDIVYERPGYEPLRGLEEVLRFYRDVRIVANGRHDLWRIIASDEATVCWGRFAGTSRRGEPLDERFADVYTVAGHKVTTRATYFFRAAI